MRRLYLALVIASGCTSGPATDCTHAAPGAMCEIAGTGELAFNGDNKPAMQTAFYLPSEMRRGPDGLLYIMDFNNMRLRRIEADGTITTLAGSGFHAGAMEGAPATVSPLENPIDFDFLPSGQVVFLQYHDPRIQLLADDGTVELYAGNSQQWQPGQDDGDGGPAVGARFSETTGIAVAPDGTIYISDDTGNKVRVINTAGIIETFAGTGEQGFAGDNGPATAALLNGPSALALDAAGDLFISDALNCAVREITPDGMIHTVAGIGVGGFSGDDSLATSAQLSHPDGIAVAADGTLYVGDRLNARVRKIAVDGTITSIAGTGAQGADGDGGPAVDAELSYLSRVQLDTDGGLLISDQTNSRIRKIMPPL